MKKLFLTLALMLVLTSCNQEAAKEEKPAEENAVVAENQENKEVEVAEEGTESEFIAGLDKSLISEGELEVAKEIDSEFTGNFVIFFNAETCEFTLKQRNDTDYNLVADEVKAHTYGEDADKTDWNAFVESLVAASKTYEGKEDTRQPIIKVLNPFYAKNVLVVVKDGEVLYDFATEEPKGDAGREGMALEDSLDLVK